MRDDDEPAMQLLPYMALHWFNDHLVSMAMVITNEHELKVNVTV